MTKDYIKDLELIGLTARIRRLNDKLMSSGKKVYKIFNIDIEPNWHLVLLLLEEKENLTVTEIASILDFSHPAVIKITKKMIEKKYLVSTKDKIDNRKQILSLTSKANLELPKLKEKWELIRQVHAEYTSESFMQELAQLEKKLNDKSIEQRILKKLQ
ncbi:MarR family transcriptional regulator [Lentimicrobium sp. S6]|uniref:MarR family transcriptional regulator n=1 Tax=Lentimicrobium sp. S6 TaxID=2735872 RepID=UPI0015535C14|nr:MarR family transcriptional regulator [Lentimicrobium sp. S6]NPD48065.1 MarR family transcriptional regulator [Lentimicrobium sp. S6]